MNIRARIYGSSKSQAARPADQETGGERHKTEPKRSNSRNADRHRLSQEKVRITRDSVSHEAELINVSGGGAMISATFEAEVWDSLELHLGENGTIECVIRWIRDGRMGLEFAHETKLDCSADEQAVLLREVISRTYRDAHYTKAPEPDPSVRSADEEDLNLEHRRAKRHPLIWSGVLNHDRESTPVRVRNISATGAMVQSTSKVPEGAQVVLELGDKVSVPAIVSWAVGDQVGLRFQTHFEMSCLARSTPEVAPDRWVRPSYLNKAEVEASPWDPKWQRLSVGELKHELEGFLKR